MLLNGIQHMSDRNVPVDDVYAFCTYGYGSQGDLPANAVIPHFSELPNVILCR